MKKINILLIDDDEASHMYHKIMMEDANIDVNACNSFYGSEDAINHIAAIIDTKRDEDWPHFIFVDLNMPIKSGFDFVHEFEQLSHNYPTPLIYFVSSTINPADLKKAEQMKLIHGFKTKFLEADFFASLCTSMVKQEQKLIAI